MPFLYLLFANPTARWAAVGIAVTLALWIGIAWIQGSAAERARTELTAEQAQQRETVRSQADEIRESIERRPDGDAVERLRQGGWTRD